MHKPMVISPSPRFSIALASFIVKAAQPQSQPQAQCMRADYARLRQEANLMSGGLCLTRHE